MSDTAVLAGPPAGSAVPPSAIPHDINRSLVLYRRQYNQRLLIGPALRAGLCLLCLLLGTLGAPRHGIAWWWIALPGALLTIGQMSWEGWRIRRRWLTLGDATKELDRRLHLKERLVTSVQWADAPARPRLYETLHADVQHQLTDAATERWLPRRMNAATCALIALAVLLLAWLLWPHLPPGGETSASTAQGAGGGTDGPGAGAGAGAPSGAGGQGGQQGSSGAGGGGQQQSGASGGQGQQQQQGGSGAPARHDESGGAGGGGQQQNAGQQQGSGAQPGAGQQSSQGPGSQGQSAAPSQGQGQGQVPSSGTAQPQSAGSTGAQPSSAQPSPADDKSSRQPQSSSAGQPSSASTQGQQPPSPSAAQQQGQQPQPGQQSQQGQQQQGQQQGQGQSGQQSADANQQGAPQPSSSGSQGVSPGTQQLQGDVKELLQQLSKQLDQIKQQPPPDMPDAKGAAPGANTDENLFAQPETLPEQRAADPIPLQLEADTAAGSSSSRRTATGAGQADGPTEYGAKAGTQLDEHATLGQQQEPEAATQRRYIPGEYQKVIDQLHR